MNALGSRTVLALLGTMLAAVLGQLGVDATVIPTSLTCDVSVTASCDPVTATDIAQAIGLVLAWYFRVTPRWEPSGGDKLPSK